MGVRGLTYYIENQIPQPFNKLVDVRKECGTYEKTHGKKPILVFDFRSLLYAVQKHVGHFLLGGRNNKNLETFEKLLQRLSSAADLVFYDDGPLKKEKHLTWLNRSNDRYNEMVKLCLVMEKYSMGFYDDGPLEKKLKAWLERSKKYERMVIICSEIEKSETMLSGIMENGHLSTSGWADYASFEQLARNKGKFHVAVTKECDAEIAKYANENNVLAIFANDSDFLFFAGKWEHWSVEGLNFETLNTKGYNKEALRRHLELNEEQMRVLSTLAGNDILPHDDVDVKKFHRRIRDNKEPKFTSIVKYIKKKYTELEKKENVAMAVAIQALQKSESDLVKTSLKQYDLEFTLQSESDEVLKFCLKKNLMHPYSVLKKFPGCLTIEHFDLGKEKPKECDGSYVEAMVDIYKRQCGILLCRDPRPQLWPKISFVTKNDSKSTYEHKNPEDLICPTKYKDIQKLDEFLDREEYIHYDPLRFELLLWTINNDGSLDYRECLEIPLEYYQDVMTLVCLTSHGLITTFEADIILSSIEKVETKQLPDDLDKNIPATIDYRAFQLTFLFRKFRQLVAESMQCVGLYQSMHKLNNFDGLLFHIEYNSLYYYNVTNENDRTTTKKKRTPSEMKKEKVEIEFTPAVKRYRKYVLEDDNKT